MAQANRSLSLNRDLYHDVTSRILAELERGALPWIKPWSATAGANVPAGVPFELMLYPAAQRAAWQVQRCS